MFRNIRLEIKNLNAHFLKIKERIETLQDALDYTKKHGLKLEKAQTIRAIVESLEELYPQLIEAREIIIALNYALEAQKHRKKRPFKSYIKRNFTSKLKKKAMPIKETPFKKNPLAPFAKKSNLKPLSHILALSLAHTAFAWGGGVPFTKENTHYKSLYALQRKESAKHYALEREPLSLIDSNKQQFRVKMTNNIKPYWQNYIGGHFCDGGAVPIAVENPATGEVIAEQACADASDINRAVATAKRVHESKILPNMRPVERGRMVRHIGDYLLSHREEIASLLTLESGKPYWEAMIEVEGAARYFEYYGNQAETLEGRSIPLGESYYDFTSYEPMGVSAQIIPWNYPLEMTARSLAPALATGNSCVIKSPELDPLTQYWIALAVKDAGFPKGAVNILCGHGAEAGAALSSHPDINQVIFTGSVETGIKIATAAAHNIVPCVLELGGKSAAILCEDADLEKFMTDLRWGIFFNAGQVCSAMSRVIVHESRYDELVEKAVSLAKSIKVGPGSEHKTFGATMGAMASLSQLERALRLIETAQSQGAKIATGGRKLNRKGAFLEPTIMVDVTSEMDIAQTEIFAPVVSIMPYQSEEEALTISNSTDYGLVGGVFTQDIDRALRVARETRAGQIFINEWFAGGVETPFGGYGKSGYGREKGREALWNYVQTKNIAMKIA